MQLLCTTIVGGAFLPLLAGAMSGAHGYIASFVAPKHCYVLVCMLFVAAGRAAVNWREDPPAAATVY